MRFLLHFFLPLGGTLAALAEGAFLDGVLAMVVNVWSVRCNRGSNFVSYRIWRHGFKRGVGWQDNPCPFFDSLDEQQISGAVSSKSRTWYHPHSRGKDSINLALGI